MRILVLGWDGYIGWPLTLHLLSKGHEVAGIDNHSRRLRSNFNSLTPIKSPIERLSILGKFNGWINEFGDFDLTSTDHVFKFIEWVRPDAIVHLAEQPSAPWSMKSVYNAVDTQMENVVGTLNILWAMYKYCPEAHLVKLGTMGEYGCYDDRTEILTKDGWILFNQLKGTEEVAVRTKEDRHLKFKVPNSVHEYDFDGKLYNLESNRLSMMVTPNHRMFTVKRSGSEYYGLREEIAENIINKSRVYDIGFEWDGEDIDTFDVLGNIIPAKIWLKFLGWFLSEGSVEVRKDRPNPYRIIIKQKNTQSHETRNCMQDIADILDVSFHEYKEGNIDIFILSGKDLANYMLNRFGRSKDKFIPQDIKQLNQKHLNTLLGYLLAGDGWKHHRGFRYATISKRLADDIQEIVLKCGWAATISYRIISSGSIMYTVNISKSVYSHVNHNKAYFNDSWVPYKGKVYCVNVGGDGIIFVRRNGKPYWSGNTPNCDIPEGRVPEECLSHNCDERGDKVLCSMKGLLFPRTAGSWYHLSKVHDTHNVEFACRNWGLRSTDIMQGVVYGLVDTRTDLVTRFDYDEYFGTVINRFCAQAIAGHPLTIYGDGGQTRGYLPLRESIKCLTLALEHPPSPGEYRTFNQLAELKSINELALLVMQAGDKLDIPKVVPNNIDNPRKEMEQHYYNVTVDGLPRIGYIPDLRMADDIYHLMCNIKKYSNKVDQSLIMPQTRWAI